MTDLGQVPIAALAPLVVAALAFVAYCLFDLTRSQVRYLPKWVWAVICVVSIPVGGIVYLLIGRQPQ
ncbi:PLDc N-terminal domain-containing protein [Rhizocola hellebori]|uniref:PLDc N-terminal domain-containing protein n=1 Tax=Rhizocola hellebori TaxID=1392758 RepID=UPI00194443F3|nr:PLDc N-terminal domain-containing protein [Rhizocola hellebori]